MSGVGGRVRCAVWDGWDRDQADSPSLKLGEGGLGSSDSS
jgi:hypothetical protein